MDRSKGSTDGERLDVSDLYRMPWSASDNAFGWLEVIRSCDLDCGYCYQINRPDRAKSLLEVEGELTGLLGLRRCDTVFISGGEPLLHPEIVDVVRLTRRRGVKPVLVTNGQKMTPSLLHELRKAGLFGCIFHIDSGQNRPGWADASEQDLNRLRQQMADMLSDEGGLVCGYNTTILPETLSQVPSIVE